MRHRLLVQLPQLPFDPSSGAARSMNTIAQMLAGSGFDVKVIGTTATEASPPLDALTTLTRAGVEFKPDRTFVRATGAIRWTATHRSVQYIIVDTGSVFPNAWAKERDAAIDRTLDEVLASWAPDRYLTFGGTSMEADRRRRAQAAGALVVFGLRNLSYMRDDAFRFVDAVLTPSTFVTDRYRERIGIDSTSIATPIDVESIVAPHHDPIFVTVINPSREKGLFFLTRLVETIATTHPEVPVLVVESRGTTGQLVAAGRAAGFDLARHESVMTSPGTTTPAEIYQSARVLLVPSVWEEPSGRVVAEALLNGIPPIVSDRGGLPESAGRAGRTLPIPTECQPRSSVVPTVEQVGPWVRAVAHLVEPSAHAEASRIALDEGRRFDPATLSPVYASFFESPRRIR